MPASSRKPGCLLALIVTVLVAAWWMWPSSFRYRLTIEIETPGGPVTGSAVHEIRASRSIEITPESASAIASLHGEAVAVDLPGGHTVFALLRLSSGGNSESMAYEVQKAFDPEFSGGAEGSVETVAALEGLDEEDLDPVELTPENYPLLVRFRDMRDPRTVEMVDPKDLEAAFGPGYSLNRIRVEITNDPVTTGIEKRLGWLNHLERYRTDPSNPFTNTLPREIGGFRSH